MADPRLVAADLLMRIGVDATGVDAEIASRLTRAERAAVASGDRIAGGVSRGADKATAAQLRVVAATERYNTVLQQEGATQGRIASAQASLINARRTASREVEAQTVATQRLNRETGVLSGTAKSFAAGFAGIAGAQFLRGGLEELKEASAAAGQTSAAIRSTGGAANVTAAEVDRLAGSIQRYSGQQDDAVQGAENLLLTFTKVRNEAGAGNDIFTRATRATADLAARGFGTMETSAKSLGKALNEPTRGVTALARAGITFDDAQRKTIKSLVESGDLLSAQKIILQELEREVGGSARAYGQTLPGELDRARRSLEDFEEGTIRAIGPVLKQLAGVATFFADNDTARNAALFAGGTVAALAVVNKGVKLYDEISQNVLRRSGEKVAANVAVARSYDRVATSAGRAAIAEGVESRAGAGGGLLARNGIAGATRNPRLLGLGLAGAAAGGFGLLGGGALGTAATIGGTALTGAEIGSLIAPGVGTAIGAGVGTVAGIGLSVLGPSHGDVTTTRTPKQVAADLREVNVELAKLRGAPNASTPQGVNANLARGSSLLGRQKSLSEELKAAREQATQTVSTFDETTGTFKNMTAAELAAAHATAAHTQEVKKQRQELEQRRAAFRVDPFAEQPTSERATANEIRLAELRLRATREAASTRSGKTGPVTTTSERAAVLAARERLSALQAQGGPTGVSAEDALGRLHGQIRGQRQELRDYRTLERRGLSQQGLEAVRSLEDSAPGTLHRIATSNATKYAREFNRGIRQLNRTTNATEALFHDSDTLSEQKGARDAAAYRRGWERALGHSIPKGSDPADVFRTGRLDFLQDNGAVIRRRRQP